MKYVIDHIYIPVDLSCNFEGGHICSPSFKQRFDDDFDWEVKSGTTPTDGTGPSSAESGSQYLMIESSERNEGDKAVLESGIVPANSEYRRLSS